MNRRLIVLIVLAGAIATSLAFFFVPGKDHFPVSERQASVALSVAMKKMGAPYVWASRGPDTFDSSGIIVYAYQQAIPGIEFRVGDDWPPRYAGNANHRDIYTWNFNPVPINDLLPGDLVYITDGSAPITHGMLFIERVDEETIRVLDASSRLMRVSVQDWPLNEAVRGQTLVATGRLKIKAREGWLRHEPEAP